MHELVASCFLDDYLVVRPGSTKGLRISQVSGVEAGGGRRRSLPELAGGRRRRRAARARGGAGAGAFHLRVRARVARAEPGL